MLIYVDLVHSFLVLCGILLHEPLYNSAFLLLMDIGVFILCYFQQCSNENLYTHLLMHS